MVEVEEETTGWWIFKHTVYIVSTGPNMAPLVFETKRAAQSYADLFNQMSGYTHE